MEESREFMNELSDKIKRANTVCIEAYNGMSTEYMKANKETVALMIEMDEVKKVNLEILEELKKISKFLIKELPEEVKIPIEEEIVVEEKPAPKGRPSTKKD